MGITAYEDTFKSKNNYENILTGINKEVVRINRMNLKDSMFQ